MNNTLARKKIKKEDAMSGLTNWAQEYAYVQVVLGCDTANTGGAVVVKALYAGWVVPYCLAIRSAYKAELVRREEV